MIPRILRLLFYFALLPLSLFSQAPDVALIPRPSKMQINHGELSMTDPQTLYFLEEFTPLVELIEKIPNLNLSDQEQIKKTRRNQQGIRLLKAEDYDQIDPTGYLLEIDHNGITLKAHSAKAMIPGVFSLMQIVLMSEDEKLPYLRIEDKPQFEYRGMHLDVSTHFMPVGFIKKYIDVLAVYKFNYFNWQLTGAGGWRMQINQYPELTEKAAWRTHSNWKDWQKYGSRYIREGTPNANGGYYTQEEIKAVVDYAAKRGITVVPGITVPNESDEVLAVFPELSCTGIPYTEHTLCLGNEKSFQFIKNVLNEVIAIFPSSYIHIGGKNAKQLHLENCPKCQARIDQDSLENEADLQLQFVQKLAEYLKSKNKKLIGRDAGAGAPVIQDAIVMNGNGSAVTLETVNHDRNVIVAAVNHLSFDKYQSDPRYEPEATSGYIPMEKVYHYDLIPSDLAEEKRQHILGAQASLPTTYATDDRQVEYLVFPRALAFSELVWTDSNSRSWEDFMARLQQQYRVLQKLEINYHRPSFQVLGHAEFDSVQMKNVVTLTSEQFDPQIRYTVDGTDPEPRSTLYNLPIEFSKSTTVKAASFIDSARVSDVETLDVDIHKAIGKEVSYTNLWDAFPAQGQTTLTNGKKGGLNYNDAEWQGFTEDLDIKIDFERREEISSVAMNFLQAPVPGIYFPADFKVLVSDNGKTYRELGHLKNQISPREGRLKFKKFEIKLDKPVMARYIQIKASNPTEGHILTDEVVIY